MWVWSKNIPDPKYYPVKPEVLDELTGNMYGEPRSQDVFSVKDLKKRHFIGVYVWKESQE